MNEPQDSVEFMEETNQLLVNTYQVKSNIKIVVLNQSGETVERMQLIQGRHQVDLSALPDGSYSIRFSCGENVIVKKIRIRHVLQS